MSKQVTHPPTLALSLFISRQLLSALRIVVDGFTLELAESLVRLRERAEGALCVSIARWIYIFSFLCLSVFISVFA